MEISEIMTLIAVSINGIKIRITKERLKHILENHPEIKGMEHLILETIENPDLILEGDYEEYLAVKKYLKTPVSENKYLVVVYREFENDGFVITAYFTRRYSKRRKIIWKP